MTTRQENFCDEFILQGGNASAAARASGYSANGAKVTASNLLKREDVRRSIDDRLESLRSEKVADERELLEFLSAVMRGEMTDDVVTNSGKRFTVRTSTANRLRAAETLAKIYGMFKQREDEPAIDGAALFVSTLERIAERESDKKVYQI